MSWKLFETLQLGGSSGMELPVASLDRKKTDMNFGDSARNEVHARFLRLRKHSRGMKLLGAYVGVVFAW